MADKKSFEDGDGEVEVRIPIPDEISEVPIAKALSVLSTQNSLKVFTFNP